MAKEPIDIYEVVKKLTGEVEPVGETHEDNKRFENLEVMITLVEKLHCELDDIAYRRGDCKWGSVRKACNRINKYIDGMGIKE